jgi:hypothetical protein
MATVIVSGCGETMNTPRDTVAPVVALEAEPFSL